MKSHHQPCISFYRKEETLHCYILLMCMWTELWFYSLLLCLRCFMCAVCVTVVVLYFFNNCSASRSLPFTVELMMWKLCRRGGKKLLLSLFCLSFLSVWLPLHIHTDKWCMCWPVVLRRRFVFHIFITHSFCCFKVPCCVLPCVRFLYPPPCCVCVLFVSFYLSLSLCVSAFGCELCQLLCTKYILYLASFLSR